MNDKLTEALAVYADSLIEFYDQTDLEKQHFRALVEAARRWRDFPTDEHVDMAEAAYIAYLYEHSDPLADVVDTRHAAFRAALEAVKREDR